MQTQSISQVMPLLPGLLKLSHAEKLRVVNLLLREIAAEEGINLDENIQQETPPSLEALFAALDKGRNEKPVGRLRREELYDRKLFYRY
jgi:hypothetical protein